MSSEDKTLDMGRLELLLREHFARTDKQLSDMRRDNAEFREKLMTDINSRFEGMNNRFDSLQAEIVTLQRDVDGLKHDVAGLYHWDYWLLSIILVVFAMPQIVAGVKSLFGAVADGIALVLSAFRKKGD